MDSPRLFSIAFKHGLPSIRKEGWLSFLAILLGADREMPPACLTTKLQENGIYAGYKSSPSKAFKW